MTNNESKKGCTLQALKFADFDRHSFQIINDIEDPLLLSAAPFAGNFFDFLEKQCHTQWNNIPEVDRSVGFSMEFRILRSINITKFC